MKVKLISIDLAKQVFQVCVFTERDQMIKNVRVKRAALLHTLRQYEPTRVVMEACYSANYWGREIAQLGHDVQLIPAQHVSPFLRGNKNDRNDALAIGEAAMRPSLRTMKPKSLWQQDIQLLHRLRSRHVQQCTAVCNQLRGLMSDYGVVVPQGKRKLVEALPRVLEDADNALTPVARENLARLFEELRGHIEAVARDEHQLLRLLKDNGAYQRLLSIPGIGPISASAVLAIVGDAKQFKRAREFAGWLGLTPRAYASGERCVHAGISKRGNQYLRTLLIHGARALMYRAKDRDNRLMQWLEQLIERRGKHKAMVALAHKLARFIWAVLVREQSFRIPAVTV